MSEDKKSQPSWVSRFREWIAVVVILVSVISLVIVASIALWASGGKPETAQLIFSALLPLVGTWMGTVLAFYFSKENYQVAAQLAKDTWATTIEERLRPIPVTDVMIPAHRMETHTLKAKERFDDIKLITLREEMQKAGFKRIPILHEDKHVLAVVHHEPLAGFLLDADADADLKKELKDKRNKDKREELTLGDMRAVREPLVTSFEALAAFVRQSASLAEAKNELDSTRGSQDVFVTQTGDRKEPVLGWITNNEIMSRLRS